jgi:MarR family transcriptional regulator, transcriptional regulator for hemolysin
LKGDVSHLLRPRTRLQRMDSHQHFGFLLDNVTHLYTRRFETHARGLSLTLTQCKALAALAHCEGVSQQRLAEITEIDPMRLVRILDRLEAVGWAQRRSDPQDRRAHVLAITENAKPVVERVWEIIQDTNTEALKGVTNDEFHLLMDVLKRVHANSLALEALAPGPVPA